MSILEFWSDRNLKRIRARQSYAEHEAFCDASIAHCWISDRTEIPAEV